MSRAHKTLSIVISLLLAVSLSFSVACKVITPFRPGADKDLQPVSGKELQTIEEAWNLIMEDYVDKDKIDRNALKQAAIEAMVEALKDPYTAYLTPEEYQASQAQFQGQTRLEGIGAQVAIKDELPVLTPFPDTPASRAGLKAGDKVLAIDGVSTAGLNVQEVVLKIRGPAGTRVKLLIQHLGETRPVEVEIVRASINVPSVLFEMRGNVAVIRIVQFTQRTDEEVTGALQSMDRSATGIIIDLRSNPGGVVDAVVGVASLFLKQGTVLDIVDNQGRHTPSSVRASSVTTDLPVVVLVDSFSASGSEVLAGALQDYKRATIAGSKTFGKGSVDILRQLADGSGLYLTTSRWLTPNGRLIEGQGLEPDIAVDFASVDGIQWAIDYLSSGKAR